MKFIELILIAIGLSMDAFAVAVGKGLCAKKCGIRPALITGAYFGIFQAVMPLIGYFFGIQFEEAIDAYDHWVVFGLLAVIGANMIREAFSKEKPGNGSFGFKSMIVMALATSIDALAVGITFALLHVSIVPSVLIIGAITFTLSFLGVKLGAALGLRLRSGAEIAGGVMLVLIGVKILLEHLGAVGF
jgi:Predicted membrane protein